MNQNCLPYTSEYGTLGHVMSNLFSLPGQAYDYVYGNFGSIGLMIAGVVIVVGIVGALVWFDRRK
jgi:hypothetical protein